MGRKRAVGGIEIPKWAWLVPCALVPVVLLNLGVAWLGGTQVSPLSFSFLQTKARALGAYVAHRPECVLDGHPPLEPLIEDTERRHGIPPGLLKALIQVESETRVHRISPAGAMGPGQLMPDTAALMRVEDPFDPAPSVDASGRYLAEQLRRFRDVRLAVAAYNAGPGSVNGRVPHNGETEFYVAKVLAAYEHTRPKAPVVVKRPAVSATPVKAVAVKAPVARKARPPDASAKPAVAPKRTAPVKPASRPASGSKPAAKLASATR
ncbi:transglycosylase SLT domain-containing protein [Corallococcus exiguus]|uniref:lytic transglycosylase domain-containing protein n=1 Tax=Corallococcus TaxID=83461 RepID=UPI000EA0EF11|nr:MULTISPECIES: lytic transglycosylase domain-containing protein [unclassified Corallococcus]NRD51563.1 transglycosylase SLT domain-containing protein [Corallococcus exiguus]NRD62697.1 transglycosylase SLT domain-containing protein [Corallococcus exiguus]RKH30797.1 lytic transglycosylase domain-containing protein [Corallococcus sp. CA041A]RKI14856.1 lytic transglycosylase domain-containing protein [Corallococcus sp. AB030]RUO91104.1 lytic transglycosylase domain-containing protein [Corallococ